MSYFARALTVGNAFKLTFLLRDATKQLSKRLTREREAQSTTEI
jgi:hypothetical protein